MANTIEGYNANRDKDEVFLANVPLSTLRHTLRGVYTKGAVRRFVFQAGPVVAVIKVDLLSRELPSVKVWRSLVNWMDRADYFDDKSASRGHAMWEVWTRTKAALDRAYGGKYAFHDGEEAEHLLIALDRDTMLSFDHQGSLYGGNDICKLQYAKIPHLYRNLMTKPLFWVSRYASLALPMRITAVVPLGDANDYVRPPLITMNYSLAMELLVRAGELGRDFPSALYSSNDADSHCVRIHSILANGRNPSIWYPLPFSHTSITQKVIFSGTPLNTRANVVSEPVIATFKIQPYIGTSEMAAWDSTNVIVARTEGYDHYADGDTFREMLNLNLEGAFSPRVDDGVTLQYTLNRAFYDNFGDIWTPRKYTEALTDEATLGYRGTPLASYELLYSDAFETAVSIGRGEHYHRVYGNYPTLSLQRWKSRYNDPRFVFSAPTSALAKQLRTWSLDTQAAHDFGFKL